MRLLLFTQESETSIDECLMVVPDGYDGEAAFREAAVYLGADADDISLAADVEIEGVAHGFSEYRPYIG